MWIGAWTGAVCFVNDFNEDYFPPQGVPATDPERHGGPEDRGGLPGVQLELD